MFTECSEPVWFDTEKSGQPLPEKDEMPLPSIAHKNMNRKNLSQRWRAERSGEYERQVLS